MLKTEATAIKFSTISADFERFCQILRIFSQKTPTYVLFVLAGNVALAENASESGLRRIDLVADVVFQDSHEQLKQIAYLSCYAICAYFRVIRRIEMTLKRFAADSRYAARTTLNDLLLLDVALRALKL